MSAVRAKISDPSRIPVRRWYASVFDEDFVEFERLRYPAQMNLRQARQASRLLGMHHHGNWLDICCGYGRHLLVLRSMGYSILGVDLSRSCLRSLLLEAAEAGTRVDAVCADMRYLPWHCSFDGALLLGNSLGVFDDQDDDLAVLKSIEQTLKPGGHLLIEQTNGTSLANIHLEGQRKTGSGIYRVEERVALDNRGEFYYIYRRLSQRQRQREWLLRYRRYDPGRLTCVVRRSGLEPLAVFGDYDESSWSPDSPRVVLLARKKLAGKGLQGL